MIQDAQPQEVVNKLWIKENAEEEYTVPTYAEFENAVQDVESLQSALIETEDAAYVTSMENYEAIGLTFNKLDDNRVSIYGTNSASGARQVIVLNGKKGAKTSSGAFEQVLEKGSYIFNASASGPFSNIPNLLGTYTTFANYFKINFVVIYTFDAPVMVSFQVAKNAYLGTSSDPTIITFDVQRVKTAGVKAVIDETKELRDNVAKLTKSITVPICMIYSTQEDETSSGITYINQGNGVLIDGEATGFSFYNFCDISVDKIGGVGKNIVLSYQSTDDQILMDVWALASPDNYVVASKLSSGENVLFIPNDNTITALRFRFVVYDGTRISNASAVIDGLFELPEEKQESCLLATRQLDVRGFGITINRMDENALVVYGQATATRAVFCCNGNGIINSTLMPIPLDLKAGTYIMHFETTHNDLYFAAYPNGGSTANGVHIYNGVPFTMDTDFGVGLYIKNGSDYGTEQNPSVISFHLAPLYTSKIMHKDNVVLSTENQEDRSLDIQYVLNKYGSCVLSYGDYYVSGIHMPDHTTISGQGAGSIVILLPDDGNTMVAAISMGSECTVHDLTVDGSYRAVNLLAVDVYLDCA